MHQAGKRGLETTVYRLPHVFGDRASGACQSNDLLWRILKGRIQAEAAPTEISAAFDIVPVDNACAAIITLALGDHAGGRTHHIVGAHPLTFHDAINHRTDIGYRFTAADTTQWREALRTRPDNAATAVADLFLRETTGPGALTALMTGDRTRKLPAELGHTTSAVDRDLMTAQAYYFNSTGYLPQPTPQN